MKPIKILIVEDEPILALDLATKLKKLGYEIIDIFSAGETAVNLVTQITPDLIFMDIKLKGAIDGIETATQILQIKDIPIVYLTGSADEETVERAESTGCYGYMIKPCKEIELHATIRIVLKKHQEFTKAKISQYNTFSSSSYNLVTQLPNRLFLQEKFTQTLQRQHINQRLSIVSEQSSSNTYNPSLWSRKTILLGNHKNSFNEGNQNLPYSDLKSQDTELNDFQIAAVIYLNVDRFYRINNNLGHDYGNSLLKQIAQRLKTILSDEVLIAHLNADEFALVFFTIENRQQILHLIERVNQQFYQPFCSIEEKFF